MQSLQLARLIISEFHVSDGEVISNLTLQKLMYYAHGWSMALESKELLTQENIQAWDHGPVVPSVYHHYKRQDHAITDNAAEGLYGEADDLIQLIVDHYGFIRPFGPGGLVELTHQDSPWKKNYSKGQREIVIPKNDIQSFFKNDAIENLFHAKFYTKWLDLSSSSRKRKKLSKQQSAQIDSEWQVAL